MEIFEAKNTNKIYDGGKAHVLDTAATEAELLRQVLMDLPQLLLFS